MSVKTRERQKGKDQYQPFRAAQSGHWQTPDKSEFICREYNYWLYVNLNDYLDSGLFIDSRGVRRWIRTEAKNKTFLNLFAYTGSATLAAIMGGARASLSLDISATYQDWARRNFQLNAVNARAHQLRQVDCVKWLDKVEQKYDLILLDPPSFSNSKRMQNSLDIERDHVELIQLAIDHLAPEGKLLFCCNKKGFKLAESLLALYDIEELTRATVDEDCRNSRQSHRSWLFERCYRSVQ